MVKGTIIKKPKKKMEEKTKEWIDFKNPQTGKKAGYITEKGNKKIYVSERSEDNYFRMYGGFGISEEVIQLLKEKNIEDIYIVYEPLKEAFKTTVEKISQGEEYKNIDGDDQRVLPLDKFEKMSAKKLFQKIVATLKRFIEIK